jgi:hypothetical protein
VWSDQRTISPGGRETVEIRSKPLAWTLVVDESRLLEDEPTLSLDGETGTFQNLPRMLGARVLIT